MAQEDIAHGQLVERFRFEAKRPGSDAWEPLAAATTIGHKRILRLNAPVEIAALRLVVEESRAEPRILSIGAHRSAR